MENFVYLIFGLGLMGLGAMPLIQHYFYSSDMRLTTGKIVKAEVTKERVLSAIALLPDVEYEYTVDGKLFRGTNIYSLMRSSISFFPFFGIDTKIYAIRRLQPGQNVQIYYYPNNPAESFLRLKGFHFSLLLCIICLVVGFLIFLNISASIVSHVIRSR
jgi:hypothetical protein